MRRNGKTIRQWNEDGSYASQCELLVTAMKDSALRHITAIREDDSNLSLVDAVAIVKTRVCAVDRVWREITEGK